VTHIARPTAAAKPLSVNPLKMSQPLGAALAFLGMDRCLPLFHGSQGCTAFGLVLLVRHFREAIPLQTTAMDQLSTILGGYENLEEAIRTIEARVQPALIGVATTGVTETKGEDIAGHYTNFRQRNPELAHLGLVMVNTPDFSGGFQDGFAAAVTGIVERFAAPVATPVATQVNVLAGSHLTPGDVEEIRDLIESFGLSPIILPDLSMSMSGRQPEAFTTTSLGGTTLDQVRAMGASRLTLVIGEHMRPAAVALERLTGVASVVFDRLTGLEATDAFIRQLQEISGRPAPARLRRQRESLVDAMLDGHFYFSRKRVAVALEPDLLLAVTGFLTDLGAEVVAAVSPTTSPVLERIATATVRIGDHGDLEAAAGDAGLMISNSHGRQGAQRLGIPLYRMGLPMFDRLGAGHLVSVGYRGTRNLVFDIGNLFLDSETGHAAGGAGECRKGGCACACSAG
jgi:nitrogenase molybdenum-iron protein NifN